MVAPSDDDRDEPLSKLSHGKVVRRSSLAAVDRELLRQAQNATSTFPFEEMIAQMRALTKGWQQTPSEVILRESRDER